MSKNGGDADLDVVSSERATALVAMQWSSTCLCMSTHEVSAASTLKREGRAM